jgi:6-pyruvoyltetrahydropterin/6-carboxytetrahydropterin synthase
VARIRNMPFEITATAHFSASHQLKLLDGSLEPLHGHNWKTTVTVAAKKLDKIGVVMDFHDLSRLIDRPISQMHNRHLNDLPPFKERNPSAENVALYIAESLPLPKGISLLSVQVWETAEFSAIYRL